MFGQSKFNRGFNEGQADGLAAATKLISALALPAIKARLEADASEIRALKAENALLKLQLEKATAPHTPPQVPRSNAAGDNAPEVEGMQDRG